MDLFWAEIGRQSWVDILPRTGHICGYLYKGSPNQIKVLREPHMKHNVTQFEEKNEPVNSVLGNYFIELEPWNYQAEEASDTSDAQPDLLKLKSRFR